MTTLLPDKWTADKTPAKKKLKPIEFVWYVDNDSPMPSIQKATCPPKRFPYVQRIGHNEQWDTYHAWDESYQEDPCVFLGHHNDGVIEQ